MWLVVSHCFRHHVGCGQVLMPGFTKPKTAAPELCLSAPCCMMCVLCSDAGKTTDCFTGFAGVAFSVRNLFLCLENYTLLIFSA